MNLVPVDLPPPAELRGRWAAYAAVLAATGFARGCRADGPLWHYDDAGGNWCDLLHLGEGRAVLLGNDHEYSDTYFAGAAAYFQEEETDLLAGVPDWWAAPVRAAAVGDNWVGFAYGFDGQRWWRAPYDLDDGFTGVGLPARDAERYRDLAGQFAGHATVGAHVPDPAALDALAAADGAVTPDLVRAVIGPGGGDADAGAAAARRFLTSG